MEWRKNDESEEMGNPDREADFQTEDESGAMVGGMQEKNFMAWATFDGDVR